MTEAAHSVPNFRRRLRSGGVALALGLALCAPVGFVEQARAQNLILDPYFTNGVPANQSTDAAGNTYYTYGATAGTFDGVTGVDLSGAQDGYFEIDPIAGYNTNGVNYTFSFLAAAVNSDVYTQVTAVFAPVSQGEGGCEECVNTVITETLTSTGLMQYTVTGTSSNNYGDGYGYLYVQATGTGDVFVTDLDFEQQAAPAPVPGGGILSVVAAMAALALHRMRRRRAIAA